MIDYEKLLTGDIDTDQYLTSVYEIEPILLLLNQMAGKVEFYKNLKRHRVQSIDEQIAKLEAREQLLRQVVTNTMHKHAPKEKTLHFPDVAKISRRKSPDNWAVDDETSLKDFLEQENVKDEYVRISESIDKRKLKTFLDSKAKTGVSVPGTSKVEGKESLTIKFEVKEKPASSTTDAETMDPLPFDEDILETLEV